MKCQLTVRGWPFLCPSSDICPVSMWLRRSMPHSFHHHSDGGTRAECTIPASKEALLTQFLTLKRDLVPVLLWPVYMCSTMCVAGNQGKLQWLLGWWEVFCDHRSSCCNTLWIPAWADPQTVTRMEKLVAAARGRSNNVKDGCWHGLPGLHITSSTHSAAGRSPIPLPHEGHMNMGTKALWATLMQEINVGHWNLSVDLHVLCLWQVVFKLDAGNWDPPNTFLMANVPA